MIKQLCENHLHKKKAIQHNIVFTWCKEEEKMWCKDTWKNDYPGFTDGSQWLNLERDKWPVVTNNRFSVIIY